MSMHLRLPALFAAFVFLAGGALAQSDLKQALQARPIASPTGVKFTQKHGIINFNTNVGSFKLLASDPNKAEGTLDFTFKGTVLISDLDPGSTLVVSGNVRKEIDDQHLHKAVYFGDGRITVAGKWRAVQFFGRNLRARFDGFGVLRLVGEFDKSLETGYYWYQGDDVKDYNYWNTSMNTVGVPKYEAAKPKIKFEGGGTKKG
jgi:hypothetical protein